MSPSGLLAKFSRLKFIMADYKQNLTVIPSLAARKLFTKIRDTNTTNADFTIYSSRLMRILAEEGLACLPSKPVTVMTPTNAPFEGVEVDEENVCIVSIVRAGDSLLDCVRACASKAAVGKILIQRDESTAEKLPRMYYCKLPPKVGQMQVILVDPMLATGGSCIMAIQSLLSAGVLEENIMFLNVVACPEGLQALYTAHPKVKVVTAAVDDGLNDSKYIMPGLGDYGDRFFNTTE